MSAMATAVTEDLAEMAADFSFSDIPNDTTLATFDISDTDYKKCEVAHINRAKEIIKSEFTDKTIDRLRNMGFNEERCKRLADAIMDGQQVGINAPVDYIYDYYRYYKEVESYQCLMISSPKIDKEEELKQRREEVDNFCLHVFPPEHFDEKRRQSITAYKEVSSREGVRKCIQDFFSSETDVRAKQALHAMIFFFGHGQPQGFLAGQEDMALNEILSLVKGEFVRALLHPPEHLPAVVEVIFAQCFAHLYDDGVQINRFKVLAFANHKTSSDPAGIYCSEGEVLQHYSLGSVECVDVSFSNFTTDITFDTVGISDADYKQCGINDINRAKEIIKSEFTNRTIIRLRSMVFDEERCKRLADLLMNGRKVKINADLYEINYTDYISEFSLYYESIENYQCLLISATEIGKNDDLQEHRQEMERFCLQAFPPQHFDAERLGRLITLREVSNRTHVRAFIHDFFRRQDGIRAKLAFHAVIVFFGHGSEQGFYAGKQYMHLNDIVLLVYDEWRKVLSDYPEELPVKVEIIFTQFYAHLHDQGVQTDRFRVIALTTPDHLNVLGKFVNKDLTSYAERTLNIRHI